MRQFLKLFISLIIFLVFAKIEGSCFSPCDSCPACWEGFYLGGWIGAGESREHSRFANPNYFNTLGPILLGNNFKHKTEGFIGGGALGYNYQSGCLVIGLEVGVVNSNLKKTIQSPFFAEDAFSSKLQCLASGKIRLGYDYDGLLAFISGGWAGGDNRIKLKDTFAGTTAKLKRWVNGWSIGGGFDCKCSDCISLGAAYDYIQLRYRGKVADCPSCGVGVGLGSPKISNRFYAQTLTFRINYFYN